MYFITSYIACFKHNNKTGLNDIFSILNLYAILILIVYYVQTYRLVSFYFQGNIFSLSRSLFLSEYKIFCVIFFFLFNHLNCCIFLLLFQTVLIWPADNLTVMYTLHILDVIFLFYYLWTLIFFFHDLLNSFTFYTNPIQFNLSKLFSSTIFV